MSATTCLKHRARNRRPGFCSTSGDGRIRLASMEETRTSLLHRVRNPEDRESWGEFVALYEPLLISYVRKRGLADHDAQDVVQGIFIALLRKLPSFTLDHSKGRFRTWLWQVAFHAVADWARAKARCQRAEERHRIERPNSASTPEEPDEDWIVLHHRRILEFAMEQVRGRTADKTWACFEEHLLKGRTGAEVGAKLGLPANTVYVHAARVLSRVRAQCAAYREDLGDD